MRWYYRLVAQGAVATIVGANASFATPPRPLDPLGRPVRCTIAGTQGPDLLRGTGRGDVICGLGGNDTILAGRGNDVVYGGPGADVINGGAVATRSAGEPAMTRCRPGTARETSLPAGPGTISHAPIATSIS